MEDLVKTVVGLFDNAGTKIRGYAIGLFIINCCVLALSAIATVIVCLEQGLLGLIVGVIIAFFELVLGVFAAYVVSLFLVGFGDLVQDSSENKAINKLILKKLSCDNSSAQAEDTVSRAPTVPASKEQTGEVISKDNTEPLRIGYNEFTDTYWICGNCKTKNLASRNDCWACGNKKE
jgi:hypothetical protein